MIAPSTSTAKIDATVQEACAFAGISKAVYYDECKRNPAFLDRMERAQAFPFMLAKSTVAKPSQLRTETLR